MREITSPTNSLIKVFRRSLREGMTREGWLAVEGPLMIREALQAAGRGDEKRRVRCFIHTVLCSRSASGKFAELLDQLPSEAEAVVTPDAIFEQIAGTVTPQGIAALIEVCPPKLETVLSCSNVLLMAAWGVQDPGNLGTVLRSAEALGADALITLKPSVSPHNPKILRACGGAFFRLPVFPALDATVFLGRLHEAGVRLVATNRRSPQRVSEADLRGPLAILIGNEAAGLPGGVESDACLSIPLYPGVDSLNVAVAAGIFLYEAARQRGFQY